MTNESHLPYRKDIQLSTFSILFFGTPHQGSDLASWGSLLLRVAEIYYHTDDRLVRHLRSNSESIESGLAEFASIANSILIKYFYETFPTPIKAGGSIMVSYANSDCSVANFIRLLKSHLRYPRQQTSNPSIQEDIILIWSSFPRRPSRCTLQWFNTCHLCLRTRLRPLQDDAKNGSVRRVIQLMLVLYQVLFKRKLSDLQ